jgi:hypothetical protein
MATKAMPRDFARFWAALSVSLMGSQITTLALPLLAALTLRASALEMGVLAAAGQLPFLCSACRPAPGSTACRAGPS